MARVSLCFDCLFTFDTEKTSNQNAQRAEEKAVDAIRVPWETRYFDTYLLRRSALENLRYVVSCKEGEEQLNVDSKM